MDGLDQLVIPYRYDTIKSDANNNTIRDWGDAKLDETGWNCRHCGPEKKENKNYSIIINWELDLIKQNQR